MSTIQSKDNLGTTLFGKARRGILSLLYGHADEEYYLRQIARATGLGVGPVQRELKKLADSGIIIQSRMQGRQVYYQANLDSPIFKELKSLITKTSGIADTLRSALASFVDRITVAFVFGSIASGNENKSSDIDLMIIGVISFGNVVSVLTSAERKLGREINSVVYQVAEFKKKVKADHNFVNTVLNGEKIFLIGDENELRRLAE